MIEYNNRDVAKKYAEYITGQELRRYVADKVKKYVGDSPIVFDGAVGSGQLEQYINAKYIYACEIQENSCKAFKQNYPSCEIYEGSFFNYDKDIKVDAVIMNPPFSIKFKDLSKQEQDNIQNEFSWKKSGVVDDIFVLKSLKYTKRYGFYILFPGVTYRQSEKKFRDLIGSNLLEFTIIQNAFDDTAIDVACLIIDKEKTDISVYKEIYDCKNKKIIVSEKCDNADERWRQPTLIVEKEEIDIEKIEMEIALSMKRRRRLENELDRFIKETFKNDEDTKNELQLSFFSQLCV